MLTFGLFLFYVVAEVAFNNDLTAMAAKVIMQTAFCPFSCKLM
jgi:hypothetical protein